MQWVSSTPDATSDPAVELILTSMLSCRSLRQEMMPPTVLTDDELRQITAPTAVFIGDREVIYRAGPNAALERAQMLIPNVRTVLVPGANHMLTLDAPELIVGEMMTALA
jgi:pimeloyl-ACP methyl ester carboxylesterase